MGGYAWVTLATTDSYSLGALVLAHSLKQVGTKHQLAVLITPGVTNPMRNKLREVFDLVEEVNILDSKDEKNLTLLKRPELGITFTKLHCWRLIQYEKCVFLDADTLVLENCDELFERDELSAAPDVGWPDCFNSGVFVYCPSNETFSNLIQFALDKGSFDGGDQGLLNLYFSDWAHKDIRKHLPFIYNMSSTACYSYLPAFKQFGKNAKIVHFIGGTKPWLQYFDIETRTVHPSDELKHIKEVLQYWWNIFCNSVHPSLSNEMSNPSTSTGYGSFIQNVTHTSYYYHFESPNTNVADDYKNVWDPWEEYIEKVTQNQPYSPPVHHESSQYDSSDHNHPNQDQYHSNEDQYHSHQDQNHPYPHHSNSIQEIRISETTDYHEHLNTSQLIESHNTNTEFAHHHHHEKQFSPPAYSQSQPGSPTVHYDPPSAPVHEPLQTEPPPPLPSNEFNECVATMVVSNETSLKNSHGDTQHDDSGFAGAFAKLTLGVARTPEQAALDDHLRRQGWEVGNIDYLGRDSFDNIWSKICETLAAAPPEPAPKPKEPSPPKPDAPEPSDKIEKKTEQTSQPEQPKQEVAATGAAKAAEVATAGPVCDIQASKPTEAPVTVPADTKIDTPPKQAPQSLACPISIPETETPTAAESALICPLATATSPAKEPICSASAKSEQSATICPGPVSAEPSSTEGPVCPIPSGTLATASPFVEGPICPAPTAVPDIPASSAPPSAEGPVCPAPSSTPETPAEICPALPTITQPASATPASVPESITPAVPQSPAPALTPQSTPPISVPQSPKPASVSEAVPQIPAPVSTPQSLAPASVPQSPAPASVPQSQTPTAVEQSPAPVSTPQSPAPASVPQSPATALVPQSPTPAAVPQSPAIASTPQSPAPLSVPQSPEPVSVPQSPIPAAIPQSPAPASTPQSFAPASVPQSPAPASVPQSPTPAAVEQSPAPPSMPQSVTPASDSEIPAPAVVSQSPQPDSTLQSPVTASTPQSPVPASTPQSPVPASTPQSPAPASAPQSPAPTLFAKEASKPEEPSIKPSQKEELTKSEAPKETPVSEASKSSPTEVPTAAAKPLEVSQKTQEKREKPTEQASSDSSGPTPPPRKGSGPKKSGGKGKK